MADDWEFLSALVQMEQFEASTALEVEANEQIVKCILDFFTNPNFPLPRPNRSENGFQKYYCALLDQAWRSFLEEEEVPVKMEYRSISALYDLKLSSARKNNRREADIAYGFKTSVMSLKYGKQPMVPEELFVPFVAQVKPHIENVTRRKKEEKDNLTKLLHNMILLRQHFQVLGYEGAIFGLEFLGYNISMWQLGVGDENNLPRFSCVAKKVVLDCAKGDNLRDIATLLAYYVSHCKVISTAIETKHSLPQQ